MYIFTTCKQDYIYIYINVSVYVCLYVYIYICTYIKLLRGKKTQPKIHQVSLQTNPYYEDLTSYQ